MSAINDALRRASSAAKSSPQTTAPPLPPMSVPATTPPWVEPNPASASPTSTLAAVTPPPIIAPPLPSAAMPSLRNEPPKKSSKLPIILILAFLFCIGGVAALYFFGKGRLIASAREKFQPNQEEEITDSDRLAALFGDTKAVGQIAHAAAHSNQAITSATASQAQRVVVPVTTQSAPKPNPPVPLPAPIVMAKPTPAPATPRTPVHFPTLRLQSIFYRPGNASVMINGKTLFVGDEINGVSIADIQPANVTLVLSGQTNILTLR